MTTLAFVVCFVLGVGFVLSATDDAFAAVVGGLGVGLIGFLYFLLFREVFRNFRDFFSDVVVGVVVGVGVVVVVGLLLLVVISVVVEVGQRRSAQIPTHLRAVSSLAPRTLRWVRGLLPGDEGAAWLAEVTSCLAEVRDKGERRRYIRSYRRSVPRLIWTSWALYLGVSRSRELL